MRGLHAALAMGALLSAGPAVAAQYKASEPAPEPAFRPLRPSREKLRRGRGIQAKPKKRPNRNTVSKRVRRKHRRAA